MSGECFYSGLTVLSVCSVKTEMVLQTKDLFGQSEKARVTRIQAFSNLANIRHKTKGLQTVIPEYDYFLALSRNPGNVSKPQSHSWDESQCNANRLQTKGFVRWPV